MWVTSEKSTGITITLSVPDARVPRARPPRAGPDSMCGVAALEPGSAIIRCCGTRFITEVAGTPARGRADARTRTVPPSRSAAMRTGRAFARRATTRSDEEPAI